MKEVLIKWGQPLPSGPEATVALGSGGNRCPRVRGGQFLPAVAGFCRFSLPPGVGSPRGWGYSWSSRGTPAV